jgi:hypothetical protein
MVIKALDQTCLFVYGHQSFGASKLMGESWRRCSPPFWPLPSKMKEGRHDS